MELDKILTKRLSLFKEDLNLENAFLLNDSEKNHLEKRIQEYNKANHTAFIVNFKEIEPEDECHKMIKTWNIDMDSLFEELSFEDKLILLREYKDVA